MDCLRFYIDKKQDSEHPGAHSRVIDTAETDEAKARSKVEDLLEADEEINSIASISVDFPEEYELV